MSLLSLLKKEFHWSKHNVLALVFLLLLLPSFFAYTSVAFGTALPRDVPVAVVAESDEVAESDVTLVQAGLKAFSDPTVVDTAREANDMLRRETVYAIVQVPPDMHDPDNRNATFVLSVDGSVVPYKEPSEAIRSIMEFQLDRNLEADISVDRRVVGANNTLPEYLVPIFLMVIVMLFAFTYVPYNLAREADVLDRIRVESSLETLVGAKLVYFGVLLLVPIIVFQGAAAYLGYAADALAPGSILALELTFLFLSAISMAVMILMRFRTLGRFINVVFLLGTLAFSGLGFPVGFFSPLRKAIVRAVPSHYSMIITRSAMLKGLPASTFTDWFLALGGFALLTFIALKLSIVYYRRTT
jgi:ABC-2 type transport system permease protein